MIKETGRKHHFDEATPFFPEMEEPSGEAHTVSSQVEQAPLNPQAVEKPTAAPNEDLGDTHHITHRKSRLTGTAAAANDR